ncbi:MAG: hypothetical protein J1E42_07760 [Akkermansiaceae bacterium]|nr:hypothetical protein [Akkermansiaceae bacterium]
MQAASKRNEHIFSFYWILGLTYEKKAVEFAHRNFGGHFSNQLLDRERNMKAIAIIMSLAAFTAVGNSLPPTPEAPAAVQG